MTRFDVTGFAADHPGTMTSHDALLSWVPAPALWASCVAAKYERLAELKARWDSTNLLRSNQNIAPAG